jgi:hypothetical protein
MPVTRQRTLDYMNHEWGTYVDRFHRLSRAEQTQRVHQMGYDSLRDLLAHILAWWEEGLGIILAVAQGGEFERKKYDFDAFNAGAIARYKPWEESEFMAHFESTRQKTIAGLTSVPEAAYENRRIRAWLNGVIFHHAREHLLTVSRFLVLDLLKNEWAEYLARFGQMDPQKQTEFLTKQGFATFHNLLAHIIGWWEEGIRVIAGILDSPGFTWTEQNIDPFNRELTQKYSSWSEDDLCRHYDAVRLALIDLVEDLPEDAFFNRDIERWLADDVVEHYDEHALPI